MTSQLRDLAAQIKELTRGHPAYGKAWESVSNCANHLEALGRLEEINQQPTTATATKMTEERDPAFVRFRRSIAQISDSLRPYGMALYTDTDGNIKADKTGNPSSKRVLSDEDIGTLQAAVENLRGGSNSEEAAWRIASKLEAMANDTLAP